jgi:predicted nuclease with TOPRIM domain
MSELNIMNAINAALSTLIAEHTRPLVARIQELENNNTENERRIRDLEVVKNSFELSLVDALTMIAKQDKRIHELEQNKQSAYEPGVLDIAQLCAALKHDDVVQELWHQLEDRVQGVASAEAEEAVSDHTREYDHDEIDSDSVREAVNEALADAEIRIRV